MLSVPTSSASALLNNQQPGFMQRRDGHININNVKATQIAAQTFAFGQFWRRLSHLDKFNTCQWLSACAKFGSLGNLYTHTFATGEADLFNLRGHPREYTAFLAEMQTTEQREKSQVCLCSSESRRSSSVAQGRPHCFLVQSKREIQSIIKP
jgi:hypothetical protein